jgi:hypothetical protein
MYHIVEGTGKPFLTTAPPENSICVIHDHTHASNKALLLWMISERPANLYRAAFPCCEAGCEFPELHANVCVAEYKPRVSDWSDTYNFRMVPIDDVDSEIQRVSKRCKWLWHRAHRVYDAFTGLTDACVYSAYECGFEPSDFEVDVRRCVDIVPRALVYGPVPFTERSVAACVLARLNRDAPTHLEPANDVYPTSTANEYVAKCAHNGTHVTRLPYGARVSDYAKTHENESTHARVLLRGPPVESRIAFRIETKDGKVFADPVEYIDAWIAHKLNDMEKTLYDDDFVLNASELVRSIIVSSKFVSDGDIVKKRKWIDECDADKRARIADEFGEDATKRLMELPLKFIGPDFLINCRATHPEPELKRLLTNYLSFS